MAQSIISVRVDAEDKKNFETFCEATGMNTSVAVNMFIKNVLANNRLPFSITTSTASKELKKEFNEIKKEKSKKKKKKD